MSTFTEHYNLIMPSQEDYYDVQDFNENTETLDGLLYEQETAIAQIGEKIGSPEDEGEDTLFGAIKQNREVVYVPSSNTKISLSDCVIVPEGSEKSGTFFLTCFQAKHNGTIALYFSAPSDTSSVRSAFYGLSVFPATYASAAALSNAYLVDNYLENPPVFYHLVYYGDTSFSGVMPVVKGQTYAFFIDYEKKSNFRLEEFRISYDEVKI